MQAWHWCSIKAEHILKTNITFEKIQMNNIHGFQINSAFNFISEFSLCGKSKHRMLLCDLFMLVAPNKCEYFFLLKAYIGKWMEKCNSKFYKQLSFSKKYIEIKDYFWRDVSCVGMKEFNTWAKFQSRAWVHKLAFYWCSKNIREQSCNLYYLDWLIHA